MKFLWNLNYGLIFVVLLSLLYTVLLNNNLAELKQLPSPLFGGDYYHQLGQIYYMYQSSPSQWIASSNGIVEGPAYLIVYGVLVTIFGKLFSLSALQALINFNLLLPFTSLLLFYFLYYKVFSEDPLAALGAIITVSYLSFPIFKYTDFTKFVVLPLFLIACFCFFKEQNRRNSVFLGLAYGVMSLSHATAFFFSTFLVCVITFYFLYKDYNEKKLVFTKDYFYGKRFFVIAFLVGFIIAQLYWFQPIFIYHGNSGLKNYLWGLNNEQIYTGISPLQTLFFDGSSDLFVFLKSLITLFGLYAIFTSDLKNNESIRFCLLVFLLCLFMVYSSYITMPLLNINFAPGYILSMFLFPTGTFITLVGINVITDRLKNKLAYAKQMVYLMFLLALAYYSYAAYPPWMNDSYFQFARSPMPLKYSSLQSYLLENTKLDDVVLSSNELCFMINALSGKKVVVSRRAHNDGFTQDFDQRQLDAAIILYGNDTVKRVELLKKYHISYLYFDLAWFMLEYQYNSQGNVVVYSDPLMVFYSSENEKVLQENGIKYVKTNGFVDPAIREPNMKTYDLLLVSPENYELKSGVGVWNKSINNMLTPVWFYNEQNQVSAALYKVNY